MLEYQYQYDDIGNRITSLDLGTNRTYAANNLNQYTLISNLCDSVTLRETFIPQFDDDGNQTLVMTATGVWQVQYNGENRPVLWSNGITNIVMSFDRMGRRVTKSNHRFVYDGYLQIANFEQSVTNSQPTTYNHKLFIWDPTEPVVTRPLVWNRNCGPAYYTHDGNKNVSEVVSLSGILPVHYEFTPFGNFVVQKCDADCDNPWRFSSEYWDDSTNAYYYNYRHYDLIYGRWFNRDPVFSKGIGLYVYCSNSFVAYDFLGLMIRWHEHPPGEAPRSGWNDVNWMGQTEYHNFPTLDSLYEYECAPCKIGYRGILEDMVIPEFATSFFE